MIIGNTQSVSISFLFLFFFHQSSLYPIKIFVKCFYLLVHILWYMVYIRHHIKMTDKIPPFTRKLHMRSGTTSLGPRPLRGVRRSLRGRPAPLRESAWYPLFAHASFIPRNVWDLVIFPYHVTSQIFTVEMASCFDSAISYSLNKLGCSHLTLKDDSA